MFWRFGINHFPLKTCCPCSLFLRKAERKLSSRFRTLLFSETGGERKFDRNINSFFSLFFLLCCSQCFSRRPCLKWTAGALITATTADKQGNSLFDHGNKTVASALCCGLNESFILLNHQQNQPRRVDQLLFAP